MAILVKKKSQIFPPVYLTPLIMGFPLDFVMVVGLKKARMTPVDGHGWACINQQLTDVDPGLGS